MLGISNAIKNGHFRLEWNNVQVIPKMEFPHFRSFHFVKRPSFYTLPLQIAPPLLCIWGRMCVIHESAPLQRQSLCLLLE